MASGIRIERRGGDHVDIDEALALLVAWPKATSARLVIGSGRIAAMHGLIGRDKMGKAGSKPEAR